MRGYPACGVRHPVLPARGRASRSWLWIVVAALASILAGCGVVQEELTLYEDGGYELEAQLALPSNLTNEAEIESMFETQARQAKAQGGGLRWKRLKSDPDASAYWIFINGPDYAALEGGGIYISEVQSGGPRALEVRYAPDFSYSDFQFTLHGRSILESNGEAVGKDTVTWHNPTESIRGGTMHAVLTPRGRFPFVLVIVLPLLLVAAIAGYGRYQNTRKRPVPVPAPVRAAAIAPATVFCPNCGKPNPTTVRFCMHCGHEIPQR